jgi:hypothetical protein
MCTRARARLGAPARIAHACAPGRCQRDAATHAQGGGAAVQSVLCAQHHNLGRARASSAHNRRDEDAKSPVQLVHACSAAFARPPLKPWRLWPWSASRAARLCVPLAPCVRAWLHLHLRVVHVRAPRRSKFESDAAQHTAALQRRRTPAVSTQKQAQRSPLALLTCTRRMRACALETAARRLHGRTPSASSFLKRSGSSLPSRICLRWSLNHFPSGLWTPLMVLGTATLPPFASLKATSAS